MKIYLDNAATSPLSEDTKNYLVSILDIYGNPSSTHSTGIQSKDIINNARMSVAKFLNTEAKDIIFTSGGSASNTLAIRGYIKNNECCVYYSPTLHKSALECIKHCAFLPEKLDVDKYGAIDIERFESRLKDFKLKPFVIVDYASSEIGTIQNTKEIVEITHRYNGVVYVDCTASISTIPIDLKSISIDMLGFSGHKIGSLKGIGVLYKRKGISLDTLIYGNQERGLVGGTENVLGIASLGYIVNNYDYSSISSHNRDYVHYYISNNISDTYLIGRNSDRLAHNLYVCFKGIVGESLVILLDISGIQVSTGSACSSGNLEPSESLLTIGMNKEDINSCIRMTFSGKETKEELDYICDMLKYHVTNLRQFNKK